MPGNHLLSTNQPENEAVRKLHWCYSTMCPISKLHDQVDSQHQLECISPPVGRPTTCMVTRTYMYVYVAAVVPSCLYSSPGSF